MHRLTYISTRLIGFVVFALSLVSAVWAEQSAYAQGRILVKFTGGVHPMAQQALLAHGAVAKGRFAQLGVNVFAIPADQDAKAVADELMREEGIEFAEPDNAAEPAQVIPNDPWFGPQQWGLRQIGCMDAWTITTGNPNVVIAIIDSGVYAGHQDLIGQLVPGYNVASGNTDTSDTMGHGTLVAGVAGASSNNGIGITGTAWNCKMMPVKVMHPDNTSYASDVANGLTYAADHGAKVANLSLTWGYSATIESAAAYFRSKGGVIVNAAGNTGGNTGLSNDPYMLTVSGTDGNNTLDYVSSYGNNVDICAPIFDESTTITNSYITTGGTSIATPYVAGVAALVFSVNPNLTPDQVDSILTSTATDLGTPGWDMYFGYGLLNAYGAVLKARDSLGVDSTPPAVSFSQPAANATVSGTVSVYANATDNNMVDSVTFFVDNVQQAVCTTAPYTFSLDTTTLSNASHTLKATAVDNFGNSASVSETITVSNSTPPTVSLENPTAGSTVSGTVGVTAAASGSLPVVSVTFLVDGVQQSQATSAPYTFNWNSPNVSNGSHSISAMAKDSGGNSATTSATVNVSNPDTVAPSVGLSNPVAGATVSGGVSLNATASDNMAVASVTFYVDGVQLAIDTTSPYTVSWNTTAYTNGSHTVSAVAKDAAGNSSTATAMVTVNNADTTAPTVSFSSPVSGSTVSGTSVSVSANASDNVGVASVTFLVDGVQVSQDTAAPYSFVWDSTKVVNGSHTLSAVARDAAGNATTATSTVTVSNGSAIDTTPPTIKITSPSTGLKLQMTLTVSVSATDNVKVVKVEMYLDGNLAATSTSSPFTTSINTRKLASGSHVVYCKAYDAAGNVGTSASITLNK